MTEPQWLPNVDTDAPAEPHNVEAEAAVLGAMLLDRTVIEPTEALLAGAEDFYLLHHQTIYRTITDLYARSRDPKIDPITVAAELLATGDLAKVGGAPYLHQLVAAVPTVGHAEYYADLIRENAQLRAVLTATRRATQRAMTAAGTAADILDSAMADLQAAA
ncbi:DnaB-like helicase N-terminal domain-containing protein, partial [Streptomyces albidoflavus]